MAEDMKLIPFEDMLTEFYGVKGTTHRDEHEQEVAEAVYAYRIGEAMTK